MKQAYAPNGLRIVGSVDTIPGCALVIGFEGESNDPVWVGETKMYWDGQVTETRDGEAVWQDEAGNEWKQSELTFKEESE